MKDDRDKDVNKTNNFECKIDLLCLIDIFNFIKTR